MNFLQAKDGDNKIRSENLEIVWRWQFDGRQRIKRYFQVCICGNSRLLIANFCLTCHSCGRTHSYTTYLRNQDKVKKLLTYPSDRVGRVRQYVPPRKKEIVRINARTGQIIKKPFQNKAIKDPNKVLRVYHCKKCNKDYKWTQLHYDLGVSPPMLIVEGQEMCIPCVRFYLKANKR